MEELSHIDPDGKAVMVDVSEKTATKRTAVARSVVHFPDEVFAKLKSEDFQTAKGSILNTAIIAGIMAAKKTGELIPLCHPLGLEDCQLDIQWNGNHELVIVCTTSITHKTGVEMEALVGASLAALTIYDMCKALSHDITITSIQLMKKTGGKRDFTRI